MLYFFSLTNISNEMSWIYTLLIFLVVVLGLVIARRVWKIYTAAGGAITGGCDRPDCPCGPDCQCAGNCTCGMKTGGDCGCGCGRNVVFISGINSIGKTTVGKNVVKRLSDKGLTVKLIDQDDYYLKKKPPITLGNRITTANWDHIDSFDWPRLNAVIKKARKKNKCTIVIGPALWRNKIDETPDRHFLLTHPESMSDDEIIDSIIDARKKAKKLRGRKSQKDELRVREAMWPFYKKTLTKLGTFTKLDGRQPLKKVTDTICKEIDTIVPGVPPPKGM